MNSRHALVATFTAIALLTTAGCAVTRKQESVGAYVDDTVITSKIKAHYAENKIVDATAISVETLKGTVMLSGFAKNSQERANAEAIARETKGVTMVKNQIVVRP